MDIRGQGALEYVLILSTVLVVIFGTIYLVESASTGLGAGIQTRIGDVENQVTTVLRGP